MSLRQKLILLFFILAGTVMQVIPTFRSGLTYKYGIGFWGPSGHDSIWHLSLINHIDNPLSIKMPVFSGFNLTNYHPFYDIVIAKLSQFFHLPTSLMLFQIFPIVSSIIFLILSYQMGAIITKSHKGGLILLSLNTLATSFGWVVSFLRFGNFEGESIFWSMQSTSNQINPPYQLSLILLLILFIIILKSKYLSNLSPLNYIEIFLILMLLPITKAYSAVVGFSIFSIYCLFSYIKSKNIFNLFFLFVNLIVTVLVFYHYNPNPSSILVFKPFWFINSMIESPDRIFIPFLANMRYAASLSNNIPKLIFASTVSLFIFIIGNFSWRLLGIYDSLKHPNFLKVSLLFNIFILTLIPTLFIQKGTSWNTIQFLYYALFLSNILLTYYLEKSNYLIIFLIFFCNLVGFYGTLNNYLGQTPPTALPLDEISGLKYLSTQPQGIVLTVPYDPYLKNNFKSTPVPLYAYETTAYVSAFSRKITYLEDEMNLNNSGFDFQTRHDQSTNFFKQKNVFQDRGFLVNNQIDYIYIAGKQQQIYNLNINELSLSKIFQNTGVTIYRVQR